MPPLGIHRFREQSLAPVLLKSFFFFLTNGKGVCTKQWKLVLESASTEVTGTLVPNATESQLLRQEDDQSLSPFLLHRVL